MRISNVLNSILLVLLMVGVMPTPTLSAQLAFTIKKAQPQTRVQVGQDSADGPTWKLASRSLIYEWVHPGGDYLDALGQRNGTEHFATVNSMGNPPGYWNVTNLVQKLLSENSGFHLSMTKGHIPPKFASQHTEDGPKLTVVTSAGTFEPPLLVGCWMDRSSNRCIGSNPKDLRLGFPSVLKFDFSEVAGTVKSAKLELKYTNTYANPAGLELAVNYLDMPLLITDPAKQLGGVERGIAAAVARDSDLAGHSAILWYPRMNLEANIKADWSAVSPNDPLRRLCRNPQFVDWPEFGLKALRMESQSPANKSPGDTGSSILSWRHYINENTKKVSWARALGNQPFHELYVRYMIRIDPDVYDGMTELGVKLPGFEGSGFSARMEHSAPSKANPHVYRLFIYWYGADNPFNSPTRGRPLYTKVSLRAGQIYSIEQRIKQNTRNPDGTWNPDGAIEVWVDGVKVYSNTKALINNTVWPSEINNFFANFYHGGTGMPKAPIHYEFSGIALSRQYIGPARKFTPAQ